MNRGRTAWIPAAIVITVGACLAPNQATPAPTASTATPTDAPGPSFPSGPPATHLEVWGATGGAGGWIGGPVYGAELLGPDGLRATGVLVPGERDTLTPVGTLPSWLNPGQYTITFRSRPISDAVQPGGTPGLGPVVAQCSGTFTAKDPGIAVRVDFTEAACSVTVADAPGCIAPARAHRRWPPAAS